MKILTPAFNSWPRKPQKERQNRIQVLSNWDSKVGMTKNTSQFELYEIV